MSDMDYIEFLRKSERGFVYVHVTSKSRTEHIFKNSDEAKEWSKENKVTFVVRGMGGKRRKFNYYQSE